MGVKKTSTYQTFIVAASLTIIFLIFLNTVPSIVQGVILGTGKTNTISGTHGEKINSISISTEECSSRKNKKYD